MPLYLDNLVSKMTRNDRKRGRKLERLASQTKESKPRVVDMTGVRSVEKMNDVGPCMFGNEQMEACKEPFCWDVYGDWRTCPRYVNNNPRRKTTDPYLHKSKYD